MTKDRSKKLARSKKQEIELRNLLAQRQACGDRLFNETSKFSKKVIHCSSAPIAIVGQLLKKNELKARTS